MSKLVTLQQAKKLKELGYGLTFTAFRYEKSTGGVYNSYDPLIQCQIGDLFIKAPTVSEALEWFRELKGIECEVSMSFDVNISADEAELIGYGYVIYDTKSKKISYSGTFASREVAESALLDALIECMSK